MHRGRWLVQLAWLDWLQVPAVPAQKACVPEKTLQETLHQVQQVPSLSHLLCLRTCYDLIPQVQQEVQHALGGMCFSVSET